MANETFELGYKSYEELFQKGISLICTQGSLTKTVVCRDNTVWHYNAEEDIYELDYDSEIFSI